MDERGLGSKGNRSIDGGVQAESSYLFLALAGVAVIVTGLIYVVLVICYLLMASDSNNGLQPSAEPAAKARSAVAARPAFATRAAVAAKPADDPDGTTHIVFMSENQAHFYFKNKHVGNILILTGRVRNAYSEPRSFIRLRGVLLTSDEKILADRFAYAGNMLSESDLIELPMNEILNRLQIKGGHDNVNVNVPPGADLRFMLVFNNLPDGMEQYRIDPISSDPAR